MAFEIGPLDVGKDHVVNDWMGQPPFAGRIPLYFGDDLTDEPALARVQESDGVAIKVGEDQTVARYRVAGVQGVYDGLSDWMDRRPCQIS